MSTMTSWSFAITNRQCPQHFFGPFGHECIEEGVHKRAEVAHRLFKAQSLQEDTDDEGDIEEGVVSPDGSDTPHCPPPLCCREVGSGARQGSPGVHSEEEEEGERAEHRHCKPEVVLKHSQGQDAKWNGPGNQDNCCRLTDSSVAAKTLRVGHEDVTLLGYEEHEGDVGDDAKIEDEVGGIGGEEGSTVLSLVLVHGGATEETDDVRDQEKDGNFTLLDREQTFGQILEGVKSQSNHRQPDAEGHPADHLGHLRSGSRGGVAGDVAGDHATITMQILRTGCSTDGVDAVGCNEDSVCPDSSSSSSAEGCAVSSSRQPGRRSVLQWESYSSIMALNIPGVAVMMFFYLLVLGIGIWASIKSKKEAKKGQGDKTEMALLGNRGINLVVGIFTMTGE
ncbi:hypothetical protein INR49_007599 [Caranx melampygus]|nr:hypothetical protein INR49_007599 [Caranx melampygus]